MTHFYAENDFQFHRYNFVIMESHGYSHGYSHDYHKRDLQVIRNRVRGHLLILGCLFTILTPKREDKIEIDLKKQNSQLNLICPQIK